MDDSNGQDRTAPAGSWLTEQDCRLDDFVDVVGQATDQRDYPLAESVIQDVLVYDSDRQPVDGLAPQSQAAIVWRGLQAAWDPAVLRRELAAYAARRCTDDV